ncbi:histidine phosphatase family protein [Marinobacter fonticola]|uniref:histidine phosphatase family protein n=1 Tax=Marinobacter fonticola TaxID=2603215 RepID=UPI001D0DA2C4|nr:histidine phosphatase family protein [Marinobacter fonticola]
MLCRLRFVLLALALLSGVLPLQSAAASDAAAWQALRDGEAVLILRHALAPGVGDPDNFDVSDCRTQRNLNVAGRQQARDWGAFLERHGIHEAQIFSSAWCRCKDTAELMNVGEVAIMSSLNSFFGGQGDRAAQTRQTVKSVNELPSGQPIVLVSHQVNISALTDAFTRSGEGVILALPLDEDNEVLARVMPASRP